MAVTYVRNQETGIFEQVGPGGATTDTTLSQSGKPADASAVGTALSLYAPKDAPVFTSNISMKRQSGTEVGDYSVALGCDVEASGSYSFAAGLHAKATGTRSHAVNYGTEASGPYTHAQGVRSVASGSGAHVEGLDCIASGDYSHVQGQYNIEDTENKYAHIVGNGTDDDARSNAHTLDWDGNAWYAGGAEFGGQLIVPTSRGISTYYADGDVGHLVYRSIENNTWLGEKFTTKEADVYLATNHTGKVYVSRASEDGSSHVATEVYDRGNVGVTLWEGSFSTGTITVEGLSNYSMFRIYPADIATTILCMRNGSSHIRGGSMFVSSSYTWVYSIGLTSSGDELTYVDYTGMSFTSDGFKELENGIAIKKIEGLL